MRISVIIPCHNGGPWLAKSLASVRQQTLAPHEVLFIDDASTDDSAAQARASGLGVRLLQVQVRNAAAARNAAIAEATGDWLAFLDADDWWFPEHLARAAELLDGRSDVGFFANSIKCAGDDVRLETASYCPLRGARHGLPADEFFITPDVFRAFIHSTVLLRRDRVLEVGGFDVDQKRCHDTDLWLRTIQGHTWSFDEHAAAGYRMDTPGSISKNFPECQYFLLKALLKSRNAFREGSMEPLIKTTASRAMSFNFINGSATEFRRATELAWPLLRPAARVFYSCARVWPSAFRWAIERRRELLHARRGAGFLKG